ncbi:unnamed protein product [Paramecium pentaurelia]|uniref:HTH myb-type domain-containing protein n=1 Tax=Paramecium pentaurelia TaxID=43138 RepID=A0A8S1SAR1_9CILI|nr:unnamed protein product [Paramecium pentaurelia]
MEQMQREKRCSSIKQYGFYANRDYMIQTGQKRIQYNINRKQKKKNKQKDKQGKNHSLSQFTQDEDDRILRLVQEFGPKFVKIALYFPNKSYSMVKNRYYKHLRDKYKDLYQLGCDTRIEQETMSYKPNEKLDELNQLIHSINLSPEIFSLTQTFIQHLQKCLT